MSNQSLYCPKCDAQVEVQPTTEIYARGCTNEKCDCPADAMWPSRAMYQRHQKFEAQQLADAKAAATAPDETGRGPVEVLLYSPKPAPIVDAEAPAEAEKAEVEEPAAEEAEEVTEKKTKAATSKNGRA